MDREIIAYYDRLANSYDADRFGSSYGMFVDSEERALLSDLLPSGADRILDLGCGTGRLTDFATHGCDASAVSVRLANRRHPARVIVVGDATALPYPAAQFDAVFSFHVLMHLDDEAIGALLAEVSRVLRPGGTFIADIASGYRRRLLSQAVPGWHGATSRSCRAMRASGARAGLHAAAYRGLLMIPIHRFPAAIRTSLGTLDRALCRIAPDLASYIVVVFRKKAH